MTGDFSNSALIFAPAGDVSGGAADIPVTIEMGSFSASPPSVSVAVADPTQTIDWSAQEATLKPANLDDATWQRVFANFTAAVGTTVGSLTQALAADAALLGSFGIDTQSGSEALGFDEYWGLRLPCGTRRRGLARSRLGDHRGSRPVAKRRRICDAAWTLGPVGAVHA